MNRRVREGDDEHDGDGRCDSDERPRTRRSDRDPRDECDEEERRDRECVALLDPTCELGGERGNHDRRPDRERHGHCEMLLQPGREPARAAEQNERRRHGHDAEIERQLLRMPEPVAENGGEVIRAVTDDAVGTEQTADRVTAGELRREDERRRSAEERVQAPGRANPHQPTALEHGEHERREDDSGAERNRLGAGGEREAEGDAEQHRVTPGRAGEDDERHPHHDESEWVIQVLRHHGRRVDERRQRHREHRGEQREARSGDAAGDEVGRDRRERHREAVDHLHGRIGVRERVEQRIRRRDEQRIEDAVTADRDIADLERARRGEAPAELGVRQLVRHDERRQHVPREQAPGHERAKNDRGEPCPRRHGAQPLTHRGRPRQAWRRSREPPPIPARSRLPPPPRSRRAARRRSPRSRRRPARTPRRTGRR